MLAITPALGIPDSEFQWSFARAGGPGGQNVNKVSSKARLRWNVRATSTLPPEVKARLIAQQQNRINAAGELVLESQRFRDQLKNRADCLERLRLILLRALYRPPRRKRTRPTAGSRERRLQQKRHKAARKLERRGPRPEA
jgi:ribosome-associated protein